MNQKLDTTVSVVELNKIYQLIEDIEKRELKIDEQFDMGRQQHLKLASDVSEITDQIKQDLLQAKKQGLENSEKIEEMIKASQDKKTVFNFPMSMDDPKKRGRLDEETILDALEKLRDMIQEEIKKVKDLNFKFHFEFEAKLREKVDKSALELIEKRMMENASILIESKTKKFIDKVDFKKLKISFDRQLENLFALIQSKLTNQQDGDNAIFTKKPLGQISCASCDKNIQNLQALQQMEHHNYWNRMPYRDPIERMAKVGQGFSKMLQMVKPMEIGQSRLSTLQDDTQLSGNSIMVPDLKNVMPNAQFLKNAEEKSSKIYKSQFNLQQKQVIDSNYQTQQMFQVHNNTEGSDQEISASLIHNKSQQTLPKIGKIKRTHKK